MYVGVVDGHWHPELERRTGWTFKICAMRRRRVWAAGRVMGDAIGDKQVTLGIKIVGSFVGPKVECALGTRNGHMSGISYTSLQRSIPCTGILSWSRSACSIIWETLFDTFTGGLDLDLLPTRPRAPTTHNLHRGQRSPNSRSQRRPPGSPPATLRDSTWCGPPLSSS